MNKHNEAPRITLMRRSTILAVFVAAMQIVFPAISYASTPIQPITNGFIKDVGVQVTVPTGINFSDFNTPFLNQYVTQECGVNCTVDDYKEALLRAVNPSFKIQIPQSIIPSASLLTPTYTDYVFPSNYSAQTAYNQFVYSTNQPSDNPTAFLYSLDPSVVNPQSVIIGNQQWANCPPDSTCLTWGVGWEVTQTPPTDFTPGTMKATALYLVSNATTGYAFHHIAQTPITFPNNSVGNRINGWQWKYGNFGMSWPQTNFQNNNYPFLNVNDAVELIGIGATYTSNIDNKTKWAFLHQYNNLPVPNTYIRLRQTDTYCDENNDCAESIKVSIEFPYAPETKYPIDNPTPVPNKTKVATNIEVETKTPTGWTEGQNILSITIPGLNGADAQTRACVFSDETCIISLWKAAENGYQQCTIGNVNNDCSEYVVGVNVTSPNIANYYQCRLNGTPLTLNGCTELEGKFNQPVPLYPDPSADTAPLSCAPSGFQFLNPFAYVSSTACLFQYLFIPKLGSQYYLDLLNLHIDGTILAFPKDFTNNFIDPLVDASNILPTPENCMGLGFTVPIRDALEGTRYYGYFNENFTFYPFQACNENAQKISELARTIEATMIYLFSAFTAARIVAGAFGYNLPFTNTKGPDRGVGNV
jgi:hypothetical protein